MSFIVCNQCGQRLDTHGTACRITGPPSWSPDYKSGAPLARLTEHDLIYVGDKCLNAHASKDVPPIINEAHAAALRAAFARGAEAMRDKYVAAFAHVPQVTVETLPLPEYRDHA